MKAARTALFLAAAIIIGLGMLGTMRLEKEAGTAFLLGSLTLGGGFLICGLFTLGMPWHGIIGGGVLALLGFGRGVLNFPDFAQFIVGTRPRGIAPALETAVTLVCISVLLRCYRAWAQERVRRIREDC
ncbi:hypothetical protein HZ994_03475 [Akkermansiaceae bacterium]|nr:hypothetical protein HZ994_03475 [Akkermansiaceae bacterium]